MIYIKPQIVGENVGTMKFDFDENGGHFAWKELTISFGFVILNTFPNDEL